MTEQPIGASESAEDRIKAGVPRTEDEQRLDIVEVREDLGDTVEELVRRIDVPARVKAKRDETVANVKETALHARAEAEARVPAVRPLFENPAIPAAVAAALIIIPLLVRLVRRRRTGA